MDYARFVDRGEERWAEAEALLAGWRRRGKGLTHGELERLAGAHRQVMGDLARARTHFPGTAVEARLRSLAFAGHRALSGVEEPWLRRLLRFLVRGFPQRFREAQGALLVSLSIFCAATLLGFVVGSVEPDFSAMFVGPDAIAEMKRGVIWTDQVGHVMPPSLLSSQIFTNNMSVAIFAWAGGALLGLGSLYLLVMNGVMFGSVLALAGHYDLLDRLMAWIAAHGPLELFLITVASAAGLELAWGLLAWRNRPRRETFAEAARRSLRLVGGTLPWFVLLGIVEGNVSPLMDLPTPAKGALGLALLVLFLAYTRVPAEAPPEPAP